MTRRMLAASLGLTVVVLIVLVLPLGRTFSSRERDDLVARVERDAVAIAFFVEDELDPLAEDAGINAQAVVDGYEARTGGRVVVVDSAGISVADSEPPPGEPAAGRDFSTRSEFVAALSGSVSAGIRSSETLGGRFVFVAIPVASGGDVDGAVRITYPTAEIDDRVRRNWFTLGAIAAVTLATAAVIAVVLARSVSRPLRLVQDAAARLGAGDLATRAPAGGPTEVQELAAGFNRMAARLEELVISQDQFVADASHELRTPLTALRLRLEMLDDGPDTDAALGEVARLARLVDGLLALARPDHVDAAPAERIELAACLDERRDAWEPVAEELGVGLVVDADGSAVIAGPDRIAQVFDNLLANALDASPRDTTIRIEARHGVIRVVDQGPGMSEADRERAFDRFWRASATRGSLGGSGLGLAIVAKLVACDDGEVGLDAAAGGGLAAVVRYPVG